MGYTLILTISLLKWLDALVLLSVVYSIPGTASQKFDVLITCPRVTLTVEGEQSSYYARTRTTIVLLCRILTTAATTWNALTDVTSEGNVTREGNI